MDTIYTHNLSNLTAKREREILERALGSGIYRGMVPKKGSGGMYVSVFQGWCSIQGILMFLDEDLVDLYDLGTSTSDRHAQFYIYYWPGDPANDPFENAVKGNITTHGNYTSGEPYIDYMISDYSQPDDRVDAVGTIASYSKEAAKYTIPLGDIFIPEDATNHGESKFVPRTIGHSNREIWGVTETRYQMSYEAMTADIANNTLTMRWRDLRFDAISSRKEVPGADSGPVTSVSVSGSTPNDSSPHSYTDEFSVDIGSDDLVVVYARLKNSEGENFFRDNALAGSGDEASINAIPLNSADLTSSSVTNALYEALAGDSGDYNDIDEHPNRADLVGVVPVAVVRRWSEDVIFWSNGLMMQAGHHLVRGINTNYASGVKSTLYSTQQQPDSDGYVDIDQVVSNLDILKDMGLDDAYDSVEKGSDEGAGRIINVDGEAVELKNDIGSHSSPSDPRMSALRIGGDNSHSDDENLIDMSIGQLSRYDRKKGLVFRKPLAQSTDWAWIDIDATVTWVNGKAKVNFGVDNATWQGDSYAGSHPLQSNRFTIELYNFTDGNGNDASARDTGASDTHYHIEAPDDPDADPNLYLKRTDHTYDISGDIDNIKNNPIDCKVSIWEPMAELAYTSSVRELHVWRGMAVLGDGSFAGDMSVTGKATLSETQVNKSATFLDTAEFQKHVLNDLKVVSGDLELDADKTVIFNKGLLSWDEPNKRFKMRSVDGDDAALNVDAIQSGDGVVDIQNDNGESGKGATYQTVIRGHGTLWVTDDQGDTSSGVLGTSKIKAPLGSGEIDVGKDGGGDRDGRINSRNGVRCHALVKYNFAEGQWEFVHEEGFNQLYLSASDFTSALDHTQIELELDDPPSSPEDLTITVSGETSDTESFIVANPQENQDPKKIGVRITQGPSWIVPEKSGSPSVNIHVSYATN